MEWRWSKIKDFNSIVVSKKKGEKTKVICNPTNYKLIGSGDQGAVFQLSEDKCVKLYPKSKHKKSEEEVLKDAEHSPFFPKLYETGSNYIVMEYIRGQTLDEYLRVLKELPKTITSQIINLFKEMKRLKFKRLDVRCYHLIVTESGTLKMIDHVTSRRKNRSQPKRLCEGLQQLGLLRSFVEEVKKLDTEMYNNWKKTFHTLL